MSSPHTPARRSVWTGQVLAWRQRLRGFTWPPPRDVVVRLLTATVLATALWVYVTVQQNPVRTITIPGVLVSASGVPHNEVVTLSAPTIVVTVQGLASDLRRVETALIQASVTLAHNTPLAGTYVLPVRIVSLGPHLPSSVSVVSVNPALERVAVDVVTQRTVPVSILLTGAIPTGYIAGTPYVTPPNVTVSGLLAAVNQVKGAVVDVTLSTAVHAPQQVLAPTLISAAGEPLAQPPALSPGLVTVTVPLQQVYAQKTVPVVPQLTGHPRTGYLLSNVAISPTLASLIGAQSAVIPLVSVPTSPIKVGDLAGTQTWTVDVALPPGVALVKPHQQFTVTVQSQPVFDTLPVPVSLRVVGLPAHAHATLSPLSVVAQLAGPVGLLRSVATSLTATIDVTGLVSGTYDLAPALALPASLALQSLQPLTVRVTLLYPPSIQPLPTPTPRPTTRSAQRILH